MPSYPQPSDFPSRSNTSVYITSPTKIKSLEKKLLSNKKQKDEEH